MIFDTIRVNNKKITQYYIMTQINKSIDISNLNLDNLKRISSQIDIDNIPCYQHVHERPQYKVNSDQKIVAIGDIHGDLISLLIILFGAELINKDLEWVGNNTFLVFTGDLLDDYRPDLKEMKQHPADEITIISFLADLDIQALKQGGRVLLCLGNHELMNILDNRFEYVQKSTMNYFNKYLGSRYEQFKPNSILRQKLSCLFEPFILINNKYFFCHAGITPNFLKELIDVYQTETEDINKLIFIMNIKEDFIRAPNIISQLIDFSLDMKYIVRFGYDEENPRHQWIKKNGIDFYWTRIYEDYGKGCHEFAEAIELSGLGSDLIMIKGHDNHNRIKKTCNNKIYLIDSSISRTFQNDSTKLISDNMYYLEIQNNNIHIVRIDVKDNDTIYKEKFEKFMYNDTYPYSLIEKSGIFIKSLSNVVSKLSSKLYNVVPKIPYEDDKDSTTDSELTYQEDQDVVTYYNDDGVPHDKYGRILFGGR